MSVNEMVRPRPAPNLLGLRLEALRKKAQRACDAHISKTPETITTIGIGLGKNIFHLVGFDNHPGGNITGMSSIVTDLEAKRLEILREIVPGIKRVAILGDFGNSAVVMQWDEVQTAARSPALEVAFDVRSSEDINRAFETAVGDHVDAIRIGVDGTTRPNRRLIIELASKSKLPAVYSAREFAIDGG
jgi:putative ABC transport system substrate-binding protein